jgi:hypothetical protein
MSALHRTALGSVFALSFMLFVSPIAAQSPPTAQGVGFFGIIFSYAHAFGHSARPRNE